MSEQPDAPGPRFERRDVESRSVARLGLAVVVVTAVTVWAALAVFRTLKGGPPERSVASPATLPEPRLQTDEPGDLARVESAARERLTTYGWVDRQTGIVHIPIDEAIRIVARRGVPSRLAPTDGPPSAGVPTDAGGMR